MARTTTIAPPAPSAPVLATNSLVASATRYTGARAPRIHGQVKEWQKECYRHYEICGEARYAASFFAHALGRAVLRIGRRGGSGIEYIDEGPSVDMLEALYTGPHGQAEMLASVGVHLTIAGECYLVGRKPTEDEIETGVDKKQDVWEVVSVLEMKVTGKRWAIDYGEGYAPIPLEDDDVVIRIWLPSPAKRIEADSPFRSLLPTLMEIEWLTRRLFAENSSRLAGAGLLLLPNTMTFPAPPAQEGRDISAMNEADQFLLVLADSMMASIEDPGNPAAFVPVTVMVPPESIADVRHLTFWSDPSSTTMSLRSESIQRFAIGMDLPIEQVLGMSSNGGTGGGSSNGVSHWGAWQIEEATIKMHVEPLLNVVCNALTLRYLKPGLTEATEEFITYDTTALRLRPDRSKEAMELHAIGAISTKRMLEENGFDITDLPDDEELRQWFLRKIASGSATPAQVEAALEELGIELNSVRFETLPDYGDPNETRETPLPPSLEEHPERPATPESAVSPALLAAAEGLVLRAIEKAGNRVGNQGQRGKERTAFDPFTVHVHTAINVQGPDLLKDGFACAPMLLDGIAEADEIVPHLESYCLFLFSHQKVHQRTLLEQWLGATA